MGYRRYLSLLLLSMAAFVLQAQKLPVVQKTALRAPSDIKIDGKISEWGDKFQAYNNATGVFYTLANDDENLYLTIQAVNFELIDKIVKGGIAFSVNIAAKAKNKNTPTITFPVYENKASNLYFLLNNKPEQTSDPVKNKMRADSFIRAKDQQLTEHLKWIGQKGIAAIPDTILSIYNEENIKARALFDRNLNLNCEIAIPLKYLGLSINNPAKFYYNIQLNGSAFYAVKVFEIREGLFGYVGADGLNYTAGTNGNSILFPTDFWGEYILVKK